MPTTRISSDGVWIQTLKIVLKKRFRFLHNFAVDSLDFFLTPNLRAGIKRICFRICVRYHTRQTFFFDKFAAVAWQNLGWNVHRGVHIFNPLDEQICFFFVGIAAEIDAVGKLSEFLVCGFAVRFQNVRKNDRVCKTVRYAVFAAERVRDCVDVTDVCASERFTRKICGFLFAKILCCFLLLCRAIFCYNLLAFLFFC